MARSLRQLILLPVCALWCVPAFAEPAPNPQKRARRDRDGAPSPEFENVRKAFDALTPEQRKRFQENFWRWSNLSPEEKKALRDREEVRKKFMDQEVQGAIKETGLALDDAERARFVQRYGEERRKIEEQLRKESMEKRKPLVKEMVARLKSEFSADTAAPAEAAFAPVRQP